MKGLNKKLLKYLIPSVIGVLISFGIAYYRGLFSAASTAATVMAISDGFFVTAVLYVVFGLLLVIAQSGFYDIFTYGFKSLKYLFTPIKRNRDEGGFYEYKIRQKEKRKAVPFEVLYVGLVFLALALVFALLFEKV